MLTCAIHRPSGRRVMLPSLFPRFFAIVSYLLFPVEICPGPKFRSRLPRPLALRWLRCWGFSIVFGERIKARAQRTGNPLDDTETRVNLIEFDLTQVLLTETCRLLQVLLLPTFINACFLNLLAQAHHTALLSGIYNTFQKKKSQKSVFYIQ